MEEWLDVKKQGWAGWGLWQAGEWARSYLKRVVALGTFLFGDIRAANTNTCTVPEGREVVFSLSAAIASSELHERTD